MVLQLDKKICIKPYVDFVFFFESCSQIAGLCVNKINYLVVFGFYLFLHWTLPQFVLVRQGKACQVCYMAHFLHTENSILL